MKRAALTPPFERIWEHDWHRYIQRAMSAEAQGNEEAAQSAALIAIAIALAKQDHGIREEGE